MPAAGKGTRLNLPYPKEIMRFDKDKALIDNSFDLFKESLRDEIHFVIVINEEKTEIVKYLSKYKNRFDISFTYQNPSEHEYTGAIKSAKHLFGKINLVLLPDTIVTLSRQINLVEEIDLKLKHSGFTFLFMPEKRAEMLRTKGCLVLNSSGRVIDYEDKPTEHVDRFNGYWCAFAFSHETFDASIAFMEQSTLKKNIPDQDIRKTSIFNSEIITVDAFEDLGTWSEIRKLLSK